MSNPYANSLDIDEVNFRDSLKPETKIATSTKNIATINNHHSKKSLKQIEKAASTPYDLSLESADLTNLQNKVTASVKRMGSRTRKNLIEGSDS